MNAVNPALPQPAAAVEADAASPAASTPPSAAAAAILPLLATLAAEGRPLEASYRCGGWRVVLTVEAAPDEAAGPSTARQSEMELSVLQAVAELGGQPTGVKIADAAGYPFDKGLRACLADMRRRRLLTGAHGEVGYSLTAEGRELLPLDAPARLPFVPTPFQKAILDALDGKGLRTDALGAIVGDRSRLYRPGGIKELQERGLVAHHERIGYYRPDAPPPALRDAESGYKKS